MRRLRVGVVALVVAVFAMTAVAAVPAVAQPATADGLIVVGPVVDLDATADLTISSVGYEDQAFVQQCVTAEVWSCTLLAQLVFGPSETITVTVARYIQSDAGPIDCAATQCDLRATRWDFTVRLNQPLHFRSDTLRPDPVLNVSPSQDLTHGDSVDVVLDLPAGYSNAEVVQCLAEELSEQGCKRLVSVDYGHSIGTSGDVLRDVADSVYLNAQAVRVEAQVELRQVFSSGTGPLRDCRVDDCVLALRSQTEFLAAQPVVFRTEIAVPSVATMRVSQSTALVDGQSIEIQVSAPGGEYRIQLCAIDPGGEVCGNQVITIRPPAVGAELIELRVKRYPSFGMLGVDSVSYDCVEIRCELRLAFNGALPPQIAAVEVLSFDPDAPSLLPVTSLSVPGGLVVHDGQEVAITGAMFKPGAAVLVGLCAGPNPSGLPRFDVDTAAPGCRLLDHVVADAEGSFESLITVLERTTSVEGSRIDCAATPCWFGATGFDANAAFTSDLQFVAPELLAVGGATLDRVLAATQTRILDQVHMAEEKQPASDAE